MALLKVKLRGKVVSEIRLNEEKTYTAGRKEDCDILLQGDKGISREHFQLQFQDTHWHLKVISRFGDLVVNGEKVQTQDLNEDLVFLVPPYEFEFLLSEPVVGQTHVPVVTTSKAQLTSAGSHLALVNPTAPEEYNEEKTYVGAAVVVGVLKFIDSYGSVIKEVKLDLGEVFSAGRESTCQIHINDHSVSRKQFEIRRSGAEFFITDPGSVNGTYLNGQILHANEPTPLKSGDAVSVLSHQFLFELHDPNFQNIVDQVRSLAPVDAYPQSFSPDFHPSAISFPTAGGALPSPKVAADKKKKIFRIAIGIVALLIVGVALIPAGDKKNDGKTQVANPRDPTGKLSSEQKMMVKHYYQLAENYLAQQKWILAKGEIEKIKDLLPTNYKEYERAKDIENDAEQGLLNEQEIEKLDQQQKQQKKLEEKVATQVAECKKKVNPHVTRDEMENCLQPILQFSPDDPAIRQLRAQVDQIVTDKQMKDSQNKELNKEAAMLRALFQRAQGEERSGDFLGAIRTYEGVIRSTLPDRGSYKSQSQRQISFLRGQMGSKTATLMAEAEKSAQDQQYKTAITALRKAKKIDPNNSAIDEKIDAYIKELRKSMLVIFQEGVLEENFGNIEGSEGKPGAKDKWKKILEMDVPDGEYYQKSKQRLKKYGVQ